MLAKRIKEKLSAADQSKLLEALLILALRTGPEAETLREALIKCELLQEESEELGVPEEVPEQVPTISSRGMSSTELPPLPEVDFSPVTS